MSSKRRLRRRNCENKIRYTDPDEASKAAFRMRRRDGQACNPYRCPFCGAYHVGRPHGSTAETYGGKRLWT